MEQATGNLTDGSTSKPDRRILIIDDGFVNRTVLRRIFSDRYEITEAENGEKGLEALRADPGYSAVILDLKMPVLDGYGVLAAMRSDIALSDIPVVVVTADTENKSQLLALDGGAQDVLTKPFNSEIVRRRVTNIIERREAMIASERLKLQREQLYLTSHDRLTGLLNRAAFNEKAAEIISRRPADSYVISCLDLDGFKVLNDRFGHTEGDRLLRFVADTCKKGADEAGGIICRDMADVFLTLLPNDPEKLRHVTDGILNGVRNYDLPASVSIHIGRYVIDEPQLDVNLMIDRAHMAMRSVKKSADACVAFFDGDMRREMLHRQELVDEMRPALADGQFILYFQPQYNYPSGRISGTEALVRWNHPKKGIISPADFVPLFEENGFISTLDRYVWEQACAYMRKWKDAGIPAVPVSVNISRRDISMLDLPGVLSEIVSKYGLRPGDMCLEITESAYVDHPQQLIDTVKALQKLGFIIEMDDFGSGFSSLNMLKDVPVDVLKLDMRFNSGSDGGARGGSILSSVVRMARWLKLPVIAEGVEEVRQAEYLKSIGCLFMQGFYFAMPMPAEEYEKLLMSSKTGRAVTGAYRANTNGAEDFLNASAQEALIFNSFVGGAHIVEFDGENLESLRANDSFFEILGCTREEYADNQLHLMDRLYPESRSILRETLEEAAETGKETQCELQSYPFRKGEADIWLLNRIRFLSRSGPNYVFYISIENVTEHRELEKIRLRLENIVNNVPAGIGIYEWGETVKPIYVSDRTCRMFGFTREEYEKRIADGMPINFLPDKTQYEKKEVILRSGLPFDALMPAERKDGLHFWLRLVASFVERKGAPPLVYATLFDVTKQHEKDEEYQALIGSLPGGILRYSADDGKITTVSRGLLEMLGYTRAEFDEKFGGVFDRLVYSADRERVLREIDEQIQENGSLDHCEYRIEMKDGSLRWFFDAGRLITEQDKKRWFYVILIDIDSRRKLEEELSEISKRGHTPAGSLSGV